MRFSKHNETIDMIFFWLYIEEQYVSGIVNVPAELETFDEMYSSPALVAPEHNNT